MAFGASQRRRAFGPHRCQPIFPQNTARSIVDWGAARCCQDGAVEEHRTLLHAPVGRGAVRRPNVVTHGPEEHKMQTRATGLCATLRRQRVRVAYGRGDKRHSSNVSA